MLRKNPNLAFCEIDLSTINSAGELKIHIPGVMFQMHVWRSVRIADRAHLAGENVTVLESILRHLRCDGGQR